MNALNATSLIFLLALLVSGCASKAEQQAQIRRAYAAGEQAARVQMQQAQNAQTPPPTQPTSDPQVRILGPVRNPALMWYQGLTLARALVLSEYEKQTTPSAITIYRNNQPLQVDLQSLMQGHDYPLFPGDMIYIQD